VDESRNEFEGDQVMAGSGSPNAPVIDLAAFLKFPSLSRLFQTSEPGALADMRSQLMQTNQRLERVIRQGTKEEADRAVLVSRAYTLTLNLLNELERHVTQPK
jgi:hypothetical protein